MVCTEMHGGQQKRVSDGSGCSLDCRGRIEVVLYMTKPCRIQNTTREWEDFEEWLEALTEKDPEERSFLNSGFKPEACSGNSSSAHSNS